MKYITALSGRLLCVLIIYCILKCLGFRVFFLMYFTILCLIWQPKQSQGWCILAKTEHVRETWEQSL